MPIMRCTIGGKPGWKYGVNGTCYAGEEGKAKAEQQAVAILASQAKARGNKSKESIDKYISEHAGD